jgi:NTE family protein
VANLTSAERIELLARAPLFAELEADDLAGVAALFEERVFHKGQEICREGEPGDTFFVVASGELEVRGGPEQRLLNRLGPGDVLGEMALLFEDRRTATVQAARSARLLVLGRSDFNRFFAGNPRILLHFSRLLSQRLAANARGEVARRTSTVIGVLGPAELKGKSLVAETLAALIKRFLGVDVLLVRSRPLAALSRHGKKPLPLANLVSSSQDRVKSHLEIEGEGPARLRLSVGTEDPAAQVRGYATLVSHLGELFPYMVLDLGAAGPGVEEAAREVSDSIVQLAEEAGPGGEGAGAPQRVYRILNRYNAGTPAVPINHCEPFVLPRDAELADRPLADAVGWLLAHPRSPVAVPLARLARKLLGMSVGIAVGGGAAFGISHVGVLKVFEEEDIPVDLLAGTSMGSIVAIGFASGISASEMLRIAREIGTKRTTLSALDFTLTKPGILAGDRLIRVFSPLLGAVQGFEQLRYPCRTVATDIESGERVWIGDGPLDVAFRASCSVPMLWAPVRWRGRVLVDGSMNDPVPAEVVNEMGADVCIAVNVVPRLKKGVDNVLTRLWRRASLLNPLSYLGGDRDLPNMFDIYMNSLQTLQHELGNFKAISADIRIVPDLSDFTWIEFYRPEAIIERGAAAAEAALPEVKRVLAERRARAAQGAVA